jgi:hypothetical protein
MASSVSSSINTYAGIEKYSPDFQLLGQVLNAKQTQLNYNRSKLQDFRNQLGALDVAKEEDRAYLDTRLDQVTEIANQYANMDLSSDSLTNSLIGNMGQILDGNVKSALTGTKILRNEQAEWAAANKKDPKLYSNANYAYAMQGANKWLTDGQTGTTYNGGGGFIAYTPAEDEINKNMAEAIKLATHKRDRPVAGPAGGIGGIITEEWVDRNELQNILYSKLNSNHIRQLSIDAWAKYDRLPTELLKQDYEAYTQPQIDESNSKIESLKAAIANTDNPDVKKSYQASLDSWIKSKNELENEKSFDNFLASNGKQGVYTSLHQNVVMDRFLDAYSRDPETVEIKVNEIEKANIELQMNREAVADKKAQQAIENQLKMDANEIAAYKAGLVDKNGKPIDQTKTVFQPGADIKIEAKHETNSTFSALNEKHNKLEEGIKNTLMNEMKVSEKVATAFMNSKRYADMVKNGNMAGLETIVLGEKGYTYKVSKSFRDKMTQLGADHYNSPVLTAAYEDLDNMVGVAQDAMSIAYKKGGIKQNDIPDFTIRARYADAGNGKKKIVFDQNAAGFKSPDGKSNINEYARLLNKKANLKSGEDLTDIEKVNLQLYGNLHLLNDKTLRDNPERKAFIKQRIVKQLGDLGVGAKDFQKINLNTQTYIGNKIPNTRTKIETGRDTWMSEITRGDVSSYGDRNEETKTKEEIRLNQERLDRMKAQGESSWMGLSATELQRQINEDKQKLKGSKPALDIEDHLGQGFKGIENTIEDNLVRSTNLIAGRSKVLTKASDKVMWEKLALASGISSTENMDLVLSPVIQNGEITTRLKVTTTAKVKKGEVPIEVDMNSADLKDLKIANWDVQDHRYNAVKGEYAPTLSLGNGNYSGYVNKGLNPKLKAVLLEDSKATPEIEAKTKELLADYSKGNFKIVYTPISGKYYARVLDTTDNDKDVLPGFMIPDESIISDDKASELLASPKQYADQIVNKMIEEYQTYLLNN